LSPSFVCSSTGAIARRGRLDRDTPGMRFS
jgi:hypothetical protein